MTPNRREAQELLRRLMVHYPPDIQEKLAPLIPKNRQSRPELSDVLRKLESTNLESLVQVDLQVLARAAAHLVGEASSYVAFEPKATLIAMLLRDDYQSAILELMVSHAG